VTPQYRRFTIAMLVTSGLLILEGWSAFFYFLSALADRPDMRAPFEAVIGLTIIVTAFTGIMIAVVLAEGDT